MARNTSTQPEQNEAVAASAIDFDNLDDGLIYMSVKGYVGLLPTIQPDGMDPEMVAAVNAGLKHAAYTPAQQEVDRLKKAGKSNAEITEGLNAFLKTWKPKAAEESSGYKTVRDKRLEFGREALAAALEARGNAAAAARIRDGGVVKNKSGEDILPGYMASHADEISAKVREWAYTYTAPTARKGSAASTDAEIVVDVDFNVNE